MLPTGAGAQKIHTALFWQQKPVSLGAVRESRGAFWQENEGALLPPSVGNSPEGGPQEKQHARLALRSMENG